MTLFDQEDVAELDAHLLAAMTAEVLTLTNESEPMVLGLRPLSVVQLAGLIQLALRHDRLSEQLRTVGVSFIDSVREYFAECPATLEVLRRGDDPRYDVTTERG
jgi:hypothetical protein